MEIDQTSRKSVCTIPDQPDNSVNFMLREETL